MCVNPAGSSINMAAFSMVNLFCRNNCFYGVRVGSVQSLFNGRALIRFIRATPVIKDVAPTQVLMPALSPTMEEGTIVTWLKKEGDHINPGDALCEIETDKATITMDTEEEGILAKILVPSGSEKVQVNDPIALIVEEGEDYTQISIPMIGEKWPSGGKKECNKVTALEESIQSAPHSLSPAVRFLIDTNRLDANFIPASGRGGRLLKADILRYLSGREYSNKDQAKTVAQIPPVKQPVPTDKLKPGSFAESSTRYSDIPNTVMRTSIANRLVQAKTTVPHVYVSAECVMDNLQLMRSILQEKNIKVSINDLIVKIAGVTLRQVPEMNAIWDGNEAKQMEEIDIAVDVAIDGGIITPVVRDAGNLDVSQMALVLKDLAQRARSNQLQGKEFQGGSFTISNLGMFGITEFLAVINPPQTSVLAIGSTHPSFTADEVMHNVITITLSCDGRVVNNELASRWLEAFKKNIENPTTAGL